MEKIFNLTSTFKALNEDDDGSVHICGMASTNHADRANDIIEAEAWTKGGLANFEKNPIILFNHNYDKPIGRATGLKVTENGLELKAKISKSAPDHVAQLVKEGILGAFSVGFRVKDADYLTETDGLKIKDAELFEVSVVSVPCNQAATFSLAKSFDSMDEYEEFKKSFKTNRVDLAGQSLANDENSSVASETPDGTEEVQKEIPMSEVNTPEIDLEAFAKRVAEETAAKIAMKQAEEKAAAEAEAKAAQEAEEAKAAKEAEVHSAIKVGVESGAERLMADVEAKLAEKDAKLEEVILSYKTQLEEKNDELTKIRESKRVFSDRSSGTKMSDFEKEFMHAHLLGVYTGKGWNTDYSRDLFEKAGVDYPNSGNPSTGQNLTIMVSNAIEKEVQLQYRLAQIFREMPMNSQTMILPLQRDTGLAVFNQTGAVNNGSGASVSALELAKRGGAAGDYAAEQKVLTAHRLISTTFMDNHVDEEVLVNLMPMLTEGVARAHARAVDNMVLNGNTSGPAISGLADFATASTGGNVDFDNSSVLSTDSGTLTSSLLLEARKDMGKYGLNPADVTYVVSQKRYYDLIADPAFADITDVGSDVATKITGMIGAIYGSPVIISDNFESESGSEAVAYAVATSNFVIPRLRGVSVEQDYEIARQRQIIVAHQSLGFDRLFADAAGDRACVSVNLTA